MGLFGKKANSAAAKKDEGKAKEKKAVSVPKPAKASMKDLYQEGKTGKNTAEKKPSAKTKVVNLHNKAYYHLVKPLITEKAANLGAEGKYFFAVSAASNKIEVAKAIENVYGVKPLAVNIVNVSGKKVRYGRLSGRRKDWKKAIVTLPKGKTINIYEGV